MIICVIEGFGLNLDPWTSELCPAWAEFKQRSTFYTNNYSVAASTCQACVGLLTGEYPAYSSKPSLGKGYALEMKNFHRTFLSEVQRNSIALVRGYAGPVVRGVFERTINTDAPQRELAVILRKMPRPRLIWMYIFPGVAHLIKPFCQHVRDHLPMREALSKSMAFDPVPVNTAINSLLAVRDEVVVVCGDHGNSCHSSHACNLDEGTIKTVLAIFNPRDSAARVETRLTSHLDLVVILGGLLGWSDWVFSGDAFEHGLAQREFAYSRTCFALQGQFGHAAGLDKPPRISVTNGSLRVEIALPIIAADARPKLWQRPLKGEARYFVDKKTISEPTERHQMMEQKLMALEKKYRKAALKYLQE